MLRWMVDRIYMPCSAQPDAVQQRSDVTRHATEEHPAQRNRAEEAVNTHTEHAQPHRAQELAYELLRAAGNGKAEAISLAILKASALHLDLEGFICSVDVQGDTALMVSATAGSAACIQTLLQHHPEAQLMAADRQGRHALSWAVSRGHVACVWQLLQRDAEAQVQAADRYGATALMRAAAAGHASCLSLLLQHMPWIQVEAADRYSDTALMMAVWSNHPDCVARLLAYDPAMQLAAVNNMGRCALVTAAFAGRPRCLQLLLAHGPTQQQLDEALLAAVAQASGNASPDSNTQCAEQLLTKGARLPEHAEATLRDKLYCIVQDLASRSLVPERTTEAIVGLVLALRQRGAAHTQD